MTQTKQVLPADPTAAVKQMIKQIEQFIDVMDREAMALAKRDAVAFAALQEDKQRLSESYAAASAAFGERLQEFRKVDAALIDRLTAKQEELKAKTLDSTRTLERMQTKAAAR